MTHAAYAGTAPPPSPLLQQQHSQQQQMVLYGVEIPNRVFVGSCSYNMTEMELNTLFSQFGEVRDSKIISDRDSAKSMGYGFVTFANEKDAMKAISTGHIYYKGRILYISKAVRKSAGQYQKANQEYTNGQKMIWMHPNGFLLSPQQFPSHSQPVKPHYPVMGAASAVQPSSFYYNQFTAYHPNTNAWIGLGQAHAQLPQPYYTTTDLHHTFTTPNTYQLPTTATGEDSLESSGSYTSSEQHNGTHSDEKKYTIDVKLIDEKTNQLSLDSAYTSEADLDASHNSTATNSRAASPKLATMTAKEDAKEEAASTPEKVELKAKPQRLFNEFVPSTHSTVTFSSPPALVQQPGPQQSYLPSPYTQPYIFPLSPLAVQLAQQQCFTYYPAQEMPAQIISIGSPSTGNLML